MLDCYTILDLETTGGNAQKSRITEVALVRIEQGVETARWSSLVNPSMSVPPFIEQLTGISDAMLQDAPPFDDIAPQLRKLLDGAVLVAHNARFDHSFLLAEFARIGVDLRVKTLCSVRLSRKLYPQHKSHGLDAIMARHGLTTIARHRAMGDVDLVQAFLASATAQLGAAKVAEQAQLLLQSSAALPPLLETDVKTIPDTPGVYRFYGEGSIPLYVGKSVTMRTRVMSHFQASGKVAREMRIVQEICRVEWTETAGELGALLLEARQVKDMQPILNRQLRRERGLCAWRLNTDPGAKPMLTLVRGDELVPQDFASMYGVYRSKAQATLALQELATANALCPIVLGLERGQGRCFASQIGQCKGVCCGQEKPALHHLRLQLALAKQKLHVWPYEGKVALREHNEATGRTDIHLFEQWCHLATVQDEAELAEAMQSRSNLAFDLDTYRLLVKRLAPSARGALSQLYSY